MGLLEDLAALAIRSQVIAALRADCPAELKDALEILLGNSPAIAAVQGCVMQAMKAKSPLTAEQIAALSFSPAVQQMLAEHPALIDYLVATANAKMPR